MTDTDYERLLRQVDGLSVEEQLRLASYLVERARQAAARLESPHPTVRRKWRDARGLAHPSLYGEDAQEHISRSRREGDDHRSNLLRSQR